MKSALTPTFPSRLPQVGTTVFTVMSTLATEHQAINLGQGFPDFPCDRKLIDGVNTAMLANYNQYPPMIGISELRHGISKKISDLFGHQYDPEAEITITAGGTQGILTAILCCVSPGDEVIIIEPAYDSYRPSIELASGKVVSLSLTVQRDAEGFVSYYEIPWQQLADSLNNKTRLLIVNSPHNPTGMVWQKADLDTLAKLLQNSNTLVLSDEVYEHMVFDGAKHYSIASHPLLAARSFLVSSFGKTYHVTGWKVGYVAAPALMTAEFRKVHQFNVFTVNTPMQYGLAAYLAEPNHYLQLPEFYQAKRDFFRQGLEGTHFKILPTPGTYFQCVDYSSLKIPQSQLNEADFCKWLTKEIGVAAIPLSAFYQEAVNSGVIRFCFAKKEQTLKEALMRLQSL